jgi:hypothetical protein
LTTNQQEPGLPALTIAEAAARQRTAEHQQPNQQFRLHVLLQLQEEVTTLRLIQGLLPLQSQYMRGERVLLPIQDLEGQPQQGVVLQHIADQALHQSIQDQVQVHEAAQVTHGQLREAVRVTHDQQHHPAAVQDIHSRTQAHEAARVTHGQAQAQATPDQAHLRGVVQAIQDQAPLQGVAQVIQDQAQAQATQGPVLVHVAAQVIQVLLHAAVRVHQPEDQAAVRADHPEEAQDPAPGDKKQFTYYYFLKHLSNS